MNQCPKDIFDLIANQLSIPALDRFGACNKHLHRLCENYMLNKLILDIKSKGLKKTYKQYDLECVANNGDRMTDWDNSCYCTMCNKYNILKHQRECCTCGINVCE